MEIFVYKANADKRLTLAFKPSNEAVFPLQVNVWVYGFKITACRIAVFKRQDIGNGMQADIFPDNARNYYFWRTDF